MKDDIDVIYDLSPGEEVIARVPKHWMALVPGVVVGVILMVLVWLVYINLGDFLAISDVVLSTGVYVALFFVALLLTALILVGVGIVYFIYSKSYLVLTNESVIQRTQFSLFAKKEKIISLADIEDVEYIKHGIWQTIFDYGTLKASTISDEQTYTQPYSPSPELMVRQFNNAVELFKNNRMRNQLTQLESHAPVPDAVPDPIPEPKQPA